MSDKTVVVFVHGFMGSSKQFDELSAQLADSGLELLRHVLPGHERDAAYFIDSDAEQWQKSTNELIDSLRSQYDKIVLVGHSMGGLLAVRAAVACPDKICGIIGIGFPIKVLLRPIWLKHNMLAAKPYREGEDPRIGAARKLCGVKMNGRGDYFKTFPHSMQFLRIAKLTRRELPRLQVPLSVINFENDEIVSRGAKRFIENALPTSSILMLKNSYHFLFAADELKLMADEIKKAAALAVSDCQNKEGSLA